jgi:hypothetical protein
LSSGESLISSSAPIGHCPLDETELASRKVGEDVLADEVELAPDLARRKSPNDDRQLTDERTDDSDDSVAAAIDRTFDPDRILDREDVARSSRLDEAVDDLLRHSRDVGPEADEAEDVLDFVADRPGRVERNENIAREDRAQNLSDFSVPNEV